MKKYLFISLPLFLLCTACKQEILIDEKVSSHFFLESEGAFLPVFVEGNTASKTFILFLHGGPGGSAISYNDYRLFEEMEQEFAVVYWDQRCAGSSQGNCNAKSLNIAAHVRDTELLIQLLKQRYGDDLTFFLMGHSWGGTLALAYLTKDNNQREINGCIIVDGIPKFADYKSKVSELMEHYGHRQIEADMHSEKWQTLLAELQELDSSTVEGIQRVNQLAAKGETLLEAADSIAQATTTLHDGLRVLFSSSQNLFSNMINSITTGNAMSEELIHTDLTQDLVKLDIPMALYWGKFDFVVPRSYANSIFETVSSTEKEVILFEHSGHSPMIQEKALFNASTIAFIQRYR